MDMSKRAWVSAWQTTTAMAIWISSKRTLPMTHATSITTMAMEHSAPSHSIPGSESTTTMSHGVADLLITTTMDGLTLFKSMDTFIRRSITITLARHLRIQDWSIKTWAMAISKMSLQKWGQESMPDFQVGERLLGITITTAGWTY